MKPSQLAKSGSEHGEQCAFFAFVAVARVYGFQAAWAWADGLSILPLLPPDGFKEAFPALAWVHAIPNGGSVGDDARTRKIRGSQRKAEGVREGVADIFVPIPVSQWHGLYIEMKREALRPKREGSKGGKSDAQIAFGIYCKSVAYGHVTCYGWREAVKVLENYVTWS